jgi:hypothetical protein
MELLANYIQQLIIIQSEFFTVSLYATKEKFLFLFCIYVTLLSQGNDAVARGCEYKASEVRNYKN